MTDSSVDTRASWWHLGANALAFTACFAAWMMNGVLITFLIDHGVYDWEPRHMGWLIGVPVLTGSLLRLPLGMATDRWGARWVFSILLVTSAVPMYLMGEASSYSQFLVASLGFGVIGASFAVGIAGTSVWFSKGRQGVALGVFGAGNAGAALTTLLAPSLLDWLTNDGSHIEGWRTLPKAYAALLLVTGVGYFLTTRTRVHPDAAKKTFKERLAPLRTMRVWRFGLYYFFVFGGFVALAQWLVPYYVNAYSTTVALAGMLTAVNTFPSGVIRALGGWMSDRWGARRVMYWIFGLSLATCALLVVPQMDLRSPGGGVTSRSDGVVTAVAPDRIHVYSERHEHGFDYPVQTSSGELVSDEERRSGLLVLPRSTSWQEPIVEVGDKVTKKQLLAQGTTEVFFQANIWIFTFLSFVMGAVMGVGKAAVYRHIPDYFPNDVGAVGGLVGTLGGLGGFVCPVLFGYLLDWTGLWTTCWMFFFALAAVCLIWMHTVVRRILARAVPEALRVMEEGSVTPLTSDPPPEEDLSGIAILRRRLRARLEATGGGTKKRSERGGTHATIRSLMNQELTTVTADVLAVEAVRLLVEHDISGLPVVDEEQRPIGVVTEKDLLCLFHATDLEGITVADLMTPDPLAFDVEAELVELFDALMSHTFRRVLIVDDGRLVGLISRVDVMPAILGTLEVGESREG